MKFPNMWTYPDGQAALIMDDTSKLYNTYTVPDTFLAMDEVPILDHTMLGNGFMVADQVPYLTAYETVMQNVTVCRNRPGIWALTDRAFTIT